MDPDPEVGRNIANYYRKLRESNERAAERARLAEQHQDDDGDVHQQSDPDA